MDEAPNKTRRREIPALDQQPERNAVHHPAVDGVDQPPPRRTGTLPSMAALKAPPVPESAETTRETRRAPLPWSKTIIQPPPPSSRALAKRSDPPPPESPTPVHDAPAGQADAVAALARELAEAQAEIDRLRRPAFPPPVSERPERAPAPVPSSVPPKDWRDPQLIRAARNLLIALAGPATPLGIWLTMKAQSLERAAERQDQRAQEATATASSAKAQSRDVAKELDELRARLAAREAYERALWRKLGVEYPAREGEPAEPVLETQTPVRRPGQVGTSPVLVVTKPAPP
jgi:hypothetical protein